MSGDDSNKIAATATTADTHPKIGGGVTLRDQIHEIRLELGRVLRERSRLECRITLLKSWSQILIKPLTKHRGSLVAPDLILMIICNQDKFIDLLYEHRMSWNVHDREHFLHTIGLLHQESLERRKQQK